MEPPHSTNKEGIGALGVIRAEIVNVSLAQLPLLIFPHHRHDKVVHLMIMNMQGAWREPSFHEWCTGTQNLATQCTRTCSQALAKGEQTTDDTRPTSWLQSLLALANVCALVFHLPLVGFEVRQLLLEGLNLDCQCALQVLLFHCQCPLRLLGQSCELFLLGLT